MNKKYELTKETKTLADGTDLHRIRALRDIPRHGVEAGELGGWAEKESNLSQKDGDAWVSGDAWVFGNAEVYGNAKVSGNATVFGNAEVYGNAKVSGNATVYGDAWVSGNATVCGNAKVYGDATVCGNAKVCGDADVCGNATVCGNAEVINFQDYAVHKNSWSSGRWFTYTRSNKMWKVGCFCGTGEELVKKAYADSELSGKCYEAIVRAQEAIDRAIDEKEGDTK